VVSGPLQEDRVIWCIQGPEHYYQVALAALRSPSNPTTTELLQTVKYRSNSIPWWPAAFLNRDVLGSSYQGLGETRVATKNT
jgi:hypothetical protein